MYVGDVIRCFVVSDTVKEHSRDLQCFLSRVAMNGSSSCITKSKY